MAQSGMEWYTRAMRPVTAPQSAPQRDPCPPIFSRSSMALLLLLVPWVLASLGKDNASNSNNSSENKQRRRRLLQEKDC